MLVGNAHFHIMIKPTPLVLIIVGAFLILVCGGLMPVARSLAKANRAARSRVFSWRSSQGKSSDTLAARGALGVGILIGIGFLALGISHL